MFDGVSLYVDVEAMSSREVDGDNITLLRFPARSSDHLKAGLHTSIADVLAALLPV